MSFTIDEDWYSGKIFSAIFYGIIGIIILFLWDKRKKDSKIVLLCCIVLLSINGILVFLPRKAGGSGYVYGFKGKESTRQEVDQRIDMLEPIGDKFERKDVYSTSLGASLIKDFYGTTEYFSTLNGNSSEFYRELYISPGVYGATWVLKGLDGRMELEALLSVGEIMDYTGDGFEIVYRHNDMYLPLGIAYQSWISREQFDQMNPMEKEASLIQYIVLEEQEEDIVKLVPKADEVDGSISGSNQEVTFSAVMVNVIEEGNIIHAKEDAAIRLYLNDVNVCDQKFPVETELYVKLQDMKLHDEGTADLRVGNKKIQLRNEDNDYYMGIDEFWINVTEWSSDQKGQYFEIKLPSAKSYSLGEIKVYQHNVNYNAIEERQENGLEEVQISSNQIYGRADYAEPSIVMFSIPYSKGWKAYVDGQEKPIYKADIGFIAIELEEGTHTILLKYMSPGFIPGCLCAMGGILSLAIILCKRKKKGKEQNVNSAA